MVRILGRVVSTPPVSLARKVGQRVYLPVLAVVVPRPGGGAMVVDAVRGSTPYRRSWHASSAADKFDPATIVAALAALVLGVPV